MMLTYPSVFTENLVKISPCTLVETSQFSNHVCTQLPMKMSHKSPGVTERKFMKFLPDIKGSSVVLMQQSTLRSFHLLWNTSTQNEDGVSIFTKTLGYHSNIPRVSRHSRNLSYEADLPLYICGKFSEDQSRHSGGNVFCMYASTYLLLTGHKISGVTGPKFKKFLQDVDGSSWSLSVVDILCFVIFPIVLKCQQKQ